MDNVAAREGDSSGATEKVLSQKELVKERIRAEQAKMKIREVEGEY